MVTGFPPAICVGILRTEASAAVGGTATVAGAEVAGATVAGAIVAGAIVAAGVAVPQALSTSTARIHTALNNITLDLGFIFSSPFRE
jgi:hypothetical protein